MLLLADDTELMAVRTPKIRALGSALRQAREERGLSLRDFAARIGREQSMVSRWETGNRTPRPEQVAQMLATLGVKGQRYEQIVALAYGADAPLWAATSLPEQRSQLAAFLEFEQNAAETTVVTPLLVPGLLQTRAYIRAVMSGGDVPKEEVENRAAIRIGRREVLERRNPVRLLALLGEGVLHQMIGGPEVMREQLGYLLESTKKPAVDLRIVPYSSGWTALLEGGFSLIKPNSGASVVMLENRRSGLFLHERADVVVYEEAVREIVEKARDQRDSAAIVAEQVRRLELRS